MKNMFSKGAHPSEFGHRQTTMLMLGLFLLVSQCLFAQSRIIKGTVYDEHKDALIGASVILKGTSQGTITDIDGNFSVEASDKNTVLIVSYGEFYQFNLSSCIRQQNSLTAQFVSFSLSNLANIFYPPQFLQ